MVESLESLTSYWAKSPNPLRWNCIFVLPPWLKTWWREFGSEGNLYLYAARQRGIVVGIAPLFLKGDEAKAWMVDESNLLNKTIKGESEATLHDGATVESDISSKVSKEKWIELVKNHLFVR